MLEPLNILAIAIAKFEGDKLALWGVVLPSMRSSRPTPLATGERQRLDHAVLGARFAQNSDSGATKPSVGREWHPIPTAWEFVLFAHAADRLLQSTAGVSGRHRIQEPFDTNQKA